MLVLALGVKAQGGFYIAPFVGIDGSGVTIKNDVYNMQGYTGMKAGFTGGARFQYEFTTPVLLEFQTFYNRCGYSLTIPETGLQEHVDFYLDFLSIPLLIGYNIYIGENENFVISPKAGISPNIVLSTFAKYHDLKVDTKIDNKIDWRGMLELEFAWNVNELLSVFFSIDGRAGWNIITYSNMAEISPLLKGTGVYNYVFTGNLGVKFKLSNRENKDRIYEFY